jgi:hypothetical protein
MQYSGPPLDIDAVARALSYVWRESLERLTRENGGEIYVPVLEHPRVYERIVELLQQYDEVRTRHIAFLRDELIRLKNVTIEPILLQRSARGESQAAPP